MNYRGYRCRLSGVYKLVRDKKLRALEIYNDDEEIFKSDFIYEDEKKAYKDAKRMIRLKRFDTEIIRGSVNKNNLKSDKSYRVMKLFANVNKAIIVSIVGMLVFYLGCLFGLNQLDLTYMLFAILYVVMGIMFALGMLIFGVYGKGEFIPQYNPIPFVEDVKGWYSSTSFIGLLCQGFLGFFLIYGCYLENVFGWLFWCVVISYIIFMFNYILCVIWEILDAKLKGKGFPFKRVLSPLYTVFIIALFIFIVLSICLWVFYFSS